jgi:hypothetical protein
MPDIDRPSHLWPRVHYRVAFVVDIEEVADKEGGSDDDRTMVDLKRKRESGTSKGGASSPGGGFFPIPPKKPRVAA